MMVDPLPLYHTSFYPQLISHYANYPNLNGMVYLKHLIANLNILIVHPNGTKPQTRKHLKQIAHYQFQRGLVTVEKCTSDI